MDFSDTIKISRKRVCFLYCARASLARLLASPVSQSTHLKIKINPSLIQWPSRDYLKCFLLFRPSLVSLFCFKSSQGQSLPFDSSPALAIRHYWPLIPFLPFSHVFLENDTPRFRNELIIELSKTNLISLFDFYSKLVNLVYRSFEETDGATMLLKVLIVYLFKLYFRTFLYSPWSRKFASSPRSIFWIG